MATATKKTMKKKTANKTPSRKKAADAKRSPRKKAAGKKAASKRTAVLKSATRAVKKTAASAAGATPKRTRLLNIDYSLCRGCGGCADAFPRLFEMRGDLAWVINTESFDPRRDGGVMTVCPYYAISLE